MKQQFFFLLTAGLLVGAQMQATDYVKNGSFESSTEDTFINYSDPGGVWQPDGWKIDYYTSRLGQTSDNWDQCLSSFGKDASGASLGVSAEGGNKFFYTCMRWQRNASIALSQKIQVPAGQMAVSFFAISPDKADWNNKFSILQGTDTLQKVNINTDDATTWQKYTMLLNVAEATELKIVFDVVHVTIPTSILASNKDSQQRLFIDKVVVNDDPAMLFNEQLSDLCSTVKSLDFTNCPKGYEEKLNKLADNITNNVIGKVTNLDLLKATYAELDGVYKEYLSSTAIFTALDDLDAEALNLVKADTHYPGYNTFVKAETLVYEILSGENSLKADFEQAIADLKTAIRTYKLSQQQTASLTSPVDFTFLIDAPNFTKEGGDISLYDDRDQGLWVKGSNWTAPASGDERIGNKAEKNCYNVWANNWTGTMDVHQNLAELPEGLYNLSGLVFTTGTQQSTTIHVYANSTLQSVVSPLPKNPATDSEDNATWEELITPKVIVDTDGKLTIGTRSTSEVANASLNWFCTTGFNLIYYGKVTDDKYYVDALNTRILEADALAAKGMLASNGATFSLAITAAKQAATTGTDLKNAIAKLNAAIAVADTCVKAMSNFKAGSYQTLVTLENATSTSAELKSYITQKIADVDVTLTDLATTDGAFATLETSLAAVATYATAYTELSSALTLNAETAVVLQNLQVDYMQKASTATEEDLLVYAAELKALADFASTYADAVALSKDKTYSDSGRAIFTQSLAATLNSLTDYKALAGVLKQIDTAIVALKSEIAVQPVDEITSSWIVNASTDATDGTSTVNGWTITHNGNTNTGGGEYWNPDNTHRYLDSWANAAGKLQYMAKQRIFGLPNGTYKLQAAVRADGAGAKIFTITGMDTTFVDIPGLGNTAGSIWKNAEAESTIKGVNGGAGYGWSWVEIPSINVGHNELVFGATNVNSFTGDIWAGWWFSATDFRLFYVNANYEECPGVNIDETLADEVASVYVENGYIRVVGTTSYEIFTLTGISVKADAPLISGIYLVKVGKQTFKVAVK